MADYINNPASKGPAGGWGARKSIARIYGEIDPPATFLDALSRQTKPGGFMGVSCAWPKPKNDRPSEFLENGAKATIWQLTNARCTPNFWNEHSATELRCWKDHDLEMTGRLTHPMRFDHDADRYVEVTWEEAFEKVGRTLRDLKRQSVVSDPAKAIPVRIVAQENGGGVLVKGQGASSQSDVED